LIYAKLRKFGAISCNENVGIHMGCLSFASAFYNAIHFWRIFKSTDYRASRSPARLHRDTRPWPACCSNSACSRLPSTRPRRRPQPA
jgi:hypothetical protein